MSLGWQSPTHGMMMLITPGWIAAQKNAAEARLMGRHAQQGDADPSAGHVDE
jgi:hypothetical protein